MYNYRAQNAADMANKGFGVKHRVFIDAFFPHHDNYSTKPTITSNPFQDLEDAQNMPEWQITARFVSQSLSCPARCGVW